MDVAQQPPVAVDAVEPAIGLQPHLRPDAHEMGEHARRLVRVALALADLRRVDLEKADARPARELDRVPVDDARYRDELRRGGLLGRRLLARGDMLLVPRSRLRLRARVRLPPTRPRPLVSSGRRFRHRRRLHDRDRLDSR
jgi:hypothetical protein